MRQYNNNIMIIERKYAIAMLLNAYGSEEQLELKRLLSLLLGITPQMLGLYINCPKNETRFSMSSDKLEKVKKFFGLESIEEVMCKAPNLDKSVLNAFQKRLTNVS